MNMGQTVAAIARFVNTTALATILLYSGAHFVLNKETPNGPSAAGIILELKTSSGGSVGRCNELGECSLSGALTVQGQRLSTGASLTTSNGDGLYINEGGDTATGAYVLGDSLEVLTTLSGSSLISESLLSCENIQTDANGVLACNATDYLTEAELDTFSELNTQIADKTLVNEEDAVTWDSAHTFSSNLTVDATMSGSSIWTNTLDAPVSVAIQVTAYDGDTSVGTGAIFTVPETMSGYYLHDVHAQVYTAGTTNTTTIQPRWQRVAGTSFTNFLTTQLTIDSTETSSETATPAAISTSDKYVQGNDLIALYVSQVSTTPAKGLVVRLTFLPQ